MVFTHGKHVNILHDHHLIMVFIKDCVIQDICRYNNKSRRSDWSPSGERYDTWWHHEIIIFHPVRSSCCGPVSFLLAHIIVQTYPVLSHGNALSFLVGFFHFLPAYLREGFRGNMANWWWGFRGLLRCDSHLRCCHLCSHSAIKRAESNPFAGCFYVYYHFSNRCIHQVSQNEIKLIFWHFLKTWAVFVQFFNFL